MKKADAQTVHVDEDTKKINESKSYKYFFALSFPYFGKPRRIETRQPLALNHGSREASQRLNGSDAENTASGIIFDYII